MEMALQIWLFDVLASIAYMVYSNSLIHTAPRLSPPPHGRTEPTFATNQIGHGSNPAMQSQRQG